MYTGWMLTEAERSRLLGRFLTRYSEVVAHHVTENPGVRSADAVPPPAAAFKVVGVADDGEKVQALVVSVNGKTTRPDGQTYHITWSLNREAGAKPVHSNAVLSELGWTAVEPVAFEAEPFTA